MSHLTCKVSPALADVLEWYTGKLGVRRSAAIRHALETAALEAGCPKHLREKLEKSKGVGHA